MSVHNGLFSSQSASASHPGQRVDCILSDTLQRQRDSIPAGANYRHDLPRPVAYPMVAAA